MTIYTAETYEIKSIMNIYETNTETETNVTIWATSCVYLQGLPAVDYPFIVKVAFDAGDDGLLEEDFNSLDRLTANVIPIFESTYLQRVLNKKLDTVRTSANSAISPISMYQNGTIL
jgi:hypothetical protein